MKLAVITGFLGKTKDRFHEYNEALDLDGKFKLLSGIPGYSGVEVVYPYETPPAAELGPLLAKHGLSMAAVNVNVKGEPEFRNGGLELSGSGGQGQGRSLHQGGEGLRRGGRGR